jgi:nitrogen fixation protein NifB
MLELKVASRAGVGASAEGCASSGCGGSSDALSHLPEHIRAKVHNHPCYSEEAHHHYARMHVAVAPACNIQCHYCNRKYNCANESRPGVVSELLTPDQAVKKVLAVAATIPQMAVLGIAGPGDPLANPERTLATFRALAEQAPDIKLCVSTNGLALPNLVEDLCALNIDHVTLTINCVDPDVGAQIYPWIFWKNRRIKGRKAAEILIERQQRGLEMLVARGVLVKVNSVLIPGVNDEHLKEVSRLVKSKGAFLHNVMPLIAEPEHGTFYGLMGQRGPTHDELQQLQDACAGDMAMMRHCRQCRADAVGMLGEDRGAEFSLDKIETLEIDYPQAMARRRQVHAAIEAQRAAASQPPGRARS